MVRKSLNELSNFAPSHEELRRFQKLDREIQIEIIELTEAVSRNEKVPIGDRRIAQQRAEALQRISQPDPE